jgi:hypothetical protein
MFSSNTTFNIRKGFLYKDPLPSDLFNQKYDEPTYLTFKLDFYSDEGVTDNLLYDSLPQALFGLPLQQMQGHEAISTFDFDKILNDPKSLTVTADTFNIDRPYSAIEYLLSHNEDTRAWYLGRFIKGWMDLQDEYQFYFQSVSGLGELFKNTPDKGQKISHSAVLKIKCLDAIDQKVKQLLSLYRAAAWDDEYQRWILPDIFRYFKLDIYISEIRTFHQSNFANQGEFADVVTNAVTNTVNKIIGKASGKINDWTKGGIDNNTKISAQTLNLLSNFVPVTKIHCEMCEFNPVENLYEDTLDINNDKQEETSFEIRVKKAEVFYNWITNNGTYLKIRNLISNTERKSVNGIKYLDNLMNTQTDEYFNGTIRMSSDDKTRHYTEAITQGWTASLIDGLTTSINEAENILDTAAGVYQNVKFALAEKQATKDRMKKSAATAYSSAPNTMQIILQGMGNSATNPDDMTAKVLKDIGKQYKDLAKDEQEIIQKAVDKQLMIKPIDSSAKSPEKITGPKIKKDVSIGQFSLVELIDTSYDPSTELTRIVDTSYNTFTELTGIVDTSYDPSTDMTPIIKNLFIPDVSMTPVIQPEDRSTATDLDGGPLHGTLPELNMGNVLSGANDPSNNINTKNIIDNVDDILKHLGDIPLTPVIQSEDKSTATDLDGGPYGSLTSTIDYKFEPVFKPVSPDSSFQIPEIKMVSPNSDYQKSKLNPVSPDSSYQISNMTMVGLDSSYQPMEITKPELTVNYQNINLQGPELKDNYTEPKLQAGKLKDNYTEPKLQAGELTGNYQDINLQGPELTGGDIKLKLSEVEIIDNTPESKFTGVGPIVNDGEKNISIVTTPLTGDVHKSNIDIPTIIDNNSDIKASKIKHDNQMTKASPIDNGISEHNDVVGVELIDNSSKPELNDIRPLINDKHDIDTIQSKPLVGTTEHDGTIVTEEFIGHDVDLELKASDIISNDHVPEMKAPELKSTEIEHDTQLIDIDQTATKLDDLKPIDIKGNDVKPALQKQDIIQPEVSSFATVSSSHDVKLVKPDLSPSHEIELKNVKLIDGVRPATEITSGSLFEQFKKKERTHGILETEIVGNDHVAEITGGAIDQNGRINPHSTVEDILKGYGEIKKDNETKSDKPSEINAGDIVDNNKKDDKKIIVL